MTRKQIQLLADAQYLTRRYHSQDRGHVTAAEVERARRVFHRAIGASLRKVG